MADFGMALRDQASLSALTEDVNKASQIEGEQLNVESVRSSIARRLRLDIGALAPVDRHAEGVVEMLRDATANSNAPVTRERLFGWHAALFPTGYSGLVRIGVGGWRDDATGPMQVVYGPMGRQRVHFEAPLAARLKSETNRFLTWANSASSEPPLWIGTMIVADTNLLVRLATRDVAADGAAAATQGITPEGFAPQGCKDARMHAFDC